MALYTFKQLITQLALYKQAWKSQGSTKTVICAGVGVVELASPAVTVQLISKLTLACTEHTWVLQFLLSDTCVKRE